MIEFRNVCKQYNFRKNTVHALNHVSLSIEEGEIFGVVGFSGAGKSTLLRMINGLEKPDSGQVIVDGREILKLGRRELRTLRKGIGMVFQQFNQRGGLIPRSLLRNKLFQNVDEVIY